MPDDIASKSLKELTDLAHEIIKNLENKNNFENTSEDYTNLLKINKFNTKRNNKVINATKGFTKTIKMINKIVKNN